MRVLLSIWMAEVETDAISNVNQTYTDTTNDENIWTNKHTHTYTYTYIKQVKQRKQQRLTMDIKRSKQWMLQPNVINYYRHLLGVQSPFAVGQVNDGHSCAKTYTIELFEKKNIERKRA